MRFVSHIKKFGVQCIEYRSRAGAFGEEVLRPGFTAQFVLNDITDDEVKFAISVFGGQMNGVTYEQDEVTPVPILTRLSTFDTDAHDEEFEKMDRDTWNDRTKDYGLEPGSTKRTVEEKLIASQNGDMRMIEEVKVAAPWPTYNDYRGSVDDLALKCLEDGYDLTEVARYEMQNLNRKDVLDALRELYMAEQAENASAQVVNA